MIKLLFSVAALEYEQQQLRLKQQQLVAAAAAQYNAETASRAHYGLCYNSYFDTHTLIQPRFNPSICMSSQLFELTLHNALLLVMKK